MKLNVMKLNAPQKILSIDNAKLESIYRSKILYLQIKVKLTRASTTKN